MAKKRQTWKRVKAPQPWRPKPDEELVGIYLGSKIRGGRFGEYHVHYIKEQESRNHNKATGLIVYVSGSQINDLFALIEVDDLVRLVFKGLKVSKTSGNEYKTFELYTEDSVEFKLFESDAA